MFEESAPATPLTDVDLAKIGAYVLNAAAASIMMGHVSPTQSFTYIGPTDDPLGEFVRDCFTAAGDPDARARMTQFVVDAGWTRRIAAGVML